jgi:biopolymer transport protein ExbB/TolQ
MKERYFNVLISLLVSFVTLILVVLIANQLAAGSFLHRIFILLGGDLPSGIIQGAIYFLFAYGILEISRMRKTVNKEEQAFGLELLPETEQYVLTPEDVAKIKLSMLEVERKDKFLLVDLIKKACTKFRANHSVSETLEMVSRQSEIHFRNSDSEQSIIRYIAWAIPSVGFVGTVIGISSSMSVASSAVSAAGIEKVTSLLNIAFDTTLVSLVLSLVLMYMYHNMQERNEKLHAKIESYVLDNLVNRIYI